MFLCETCSSAHFPHALRWLIDVDRDEEGMKVIADLHGGDPEDLLAKAEFQEIKDRVIFEVSDLLGLRWISVDQRKA